MSRRVAKGSVPAATPPAPTPPAAPSPTEPPHATRAVAEALFQINHGTPVRDAVVSLSKEELLDLRARVKFGYDQAHKRDELDALIKAKG